MPGRAKRTKLSIFEQIKQGLEQSISQARGHRTLKTTQLPAPPPSFAPATVTAIRKKTRMSQAVFAGYLNVSKKTVQSWEQGAREPKAGEARLLQIFAVKPAAVTRLISGSPNFGRSNKTRSVTRGSSSKRT